MLGGGYQDKVYLNAQETFYIYYEQGYRWFEYDFCFLKDREHLIGSHGALPPETWDMTFEETKNIQLSYGLTPADEEWLVEVIHEHPDVQIIIDAKEKTEQGNIEVIQRIEQLQDIYNIDLSSNIIPIVFSVEMWKELETTTSFDRYLFSDYGFDGNVDALLEKVSSPKLFAVSLTTINVEGLEKVRVAGKEIFVWTIHSSAHLKHALGMHATAIYVDFPSVWEDYEQK